MYNNYLEPDISQTELFSVLYKKKKKILSCPLSQVPIDNTVITLDAKKDGWTDKRTEGRKEGRKEERERKKDREGES